MQTKTKIKKIILAEPRGFCAGVNRAIEIVNIALDIYGAPLYVRHEIVHNHHVVDDFKERGVVFVESLDEVPDNSVLIFSAHGTAPGVIEAAKERGLQFIDAVCPLVTKVHLEIMRAIKTDKKVFYIGHRGHQEVLGAIGYSPDNRDNGTNDTCKEQFNPQQNIFLLERVEEVSLLKQSLGDVNAVVATQTTLSVDDTKAIMDELAINFSRVELPRSDDICYATQNRQDAVKELVKVSDYILIIGSKTSSNTLRLLELAHNLGKDCELVPDPDKFDISVIARRSRSNLLSDGLIVGISSGASAPEFLVDTLISKLIEDDSFEYAKGSDKKYSSIIEKLVLKEEKIVFPLPSELG
jgi:4-hydroxy-3-methylbut-2-enyl diphosphate reductase